MPTLRAAIARQQDLTELDVISDRIEELAEFASLPRLQRLQLAELRGPGSLSLDTLRPLRDCASL